MVNREKEVEEPVTISTPGFLAVLAGGTKSNRVRNTIKKLTTFPTGKEQQDRTQKTQRA